MTARSRSGRSPTNTCGDLPPHSSATCFMFDWPAYCSMSLPTSVEPVNVILATSGCSASALPGHLADAVHHVEHAGRAARFDEQFGEPQAAHRRLLGGLQHHGVAGGERGRDLPRGHQQRVVPRRDGADDAERLAQHQVHDAGFGVRDRAFDLVDAFGHEADGVDHRGQVHRRACR